ncbi:MAG: TatD family hydrolase [Bacteroidota bacterium]|nr:TatD family hydrolase [Bacteroidota bacterium]
MLTDSHTHLYHFAFDKDRDQMIQRALDSGVSRMLLPNIDSSSIDSLFSLTEHFPNHCFPMMGLHPTSVKENYLEELRLIEAAMEGKDIIAIGETGMDLYWDKTFQKEQEKVFATQIRWAMELDLPLVIHARDSFQEIFRVLDKEGGPGLRGVFHSFTGGFRELEQALSYNFMIGINGIVTFKNSNLGEVVRSIPTNRLLLETDSPFLAPVPYRGRRNESSYLIETAKKAAEIYNLTLEEVARITSSNAEQLFRLKP